LGVQLDENLVIFAFAPSSILKDHGEPQVGDKLVSIGSQELHSTNQIRSLLREGEYPLTVTLQATITEDRTCVAPPKGGNLMVDIAGDSHDPVYFDYLAADFTNASHLFNEPTAIIMADPLHACYDNIINDEDVHGKIVLVKRGRCSFIQKIEYLERLGARGVVISNDGSGLLHIPKSPLGGARRTLPDIPAVMITSQAGRQLRKIIAGNFPSPEQEDGNHAHAPITVAYRPDPDVAAMWKEISPLLVSSSAWPAELSDRRKRYRKLSRTHHPDKPRGSRDRFEAIAEAYKRANYDLNPEVQAEYKGIDDYMENA
jgi:hypothetical protein